jgi:hypothetical protein
MDRTDTSRIRKRQHEELRLDVPAITHLSLTIVPNKSGSGVATLTALRVFA